MWAGLEFIIPLVLASVGGIFTMHGRLNSRISEVGARVDKVELKVAEQYVQRTELSSALEKMENHMVRIEEKLDMIVMKNGG
tara:strand:- start:52 stop:297 length:246 start_codon:yes stop_codon:yes gene_type:complete